MDPVTIATLAEQLLLLGFQIYKQVDAAKNPDVVLRPIAEIQAEADANFDKLIAAAGAELAKPE